MRRPVSAKTIAVRPKYPAHFMSEGRSWRFAKNSRRWSMKLMRGGMRDRRTSSSTNDHLGSTLEDLAAFVPPLHGRSVSKGFSERGHRLFNVGSSLFITLIAIGWIWSIKSSRDEVVAGAPSTAAIISRALTDPRSPNVAYLTDAALDFVSPL